MRYLKFKEIKCAHTPLEQVSAYQYCNGKVKKESKALTFSFVKLEEIRCDGRLIGWVGRCNECGKIYYNDRII